MTRAAPLAYLMRETLQRLESRLVPLQLQGHTSLMSIIGIALECCETMTSQLTTAMLHSEKCARLQKRL